MKTLVTIALAATLSGAAVAQTANTSTGTVPITGNAPQLCILGAPSPAAISLGTIINTSGVNAGRIAALGATNVSLPQSFCNYAGTQISVTANALLATDTSTPPAGFSRAVNYNASVAGWAAAPTSITTAATAAGTASVATVAGASVTAPRLADLTLAVSAFSVPGNALLVASGYTGSVTITLGPSPTP